MFFTLNRYTLQLNMLATAVFCAKLALQVFMRTINKKTCAPPQGNGIGAG
jgi:hypothetical protein